MKVTLLKIHALGVEGQEVEVTEARGNYLIRTGVAKLSKETKVDKNKVKTK